jgi:hypothetical protein
LLGEDQDWVIKQGEHTVPVSEGLLCPANNLKVGGYIGKNSSGEPMVAV